MSDKTEHKYVSLASLVDRSVSHMEAIVPAEHENFLEAACTINPIRITKIQGILRFIIKSLKEVGHTKINFLIPILF